MTTYALIHGAWHGGWCWAPLVAELRRHGHEAIAPDLPCEDDEATFETYAAVVEAALEGAGGDVVLVAHSLAGQTAPLVAARRPVRGIVYVAAIVAEPGRSFAEQNRDDPAPLLPGYERGLRVHGNARAWADEEVAREHMYDDVEPDLAHEAFARLRPQSRAPYGVPCPLAALPDAPVASIVCGEDRMVLPAWSRRTARERLGVEPVELPGGHTPSLAQPARLAEAITVAV
jgi:pimeloyl-ACP methyl ester carboxylesterase